MHRAVEIVQKYVYLSILFALACALFTIATPSVHAEGELLTVTPQVFDEKAQIREILKRSITLTNNTNRRLSVYTFVNNIDVIDGEQEFEENRSAANISESLANWIEITRGVIELDPGQTRQIPFLIHVSVYADPGIHHAQIAFGWGSTKRDAKERSEREPKVIINVEAEDDSKEVLQLSSFIPEKTFFLNSIASFSYLFENIGNRALSPDGEIRIYNRRGEEVGAVGVNGDDAELLPNKESQLVSTWQSEGKFGRYKAILDVEYGNKQRGTVQDTIFFWIIPWKKILAMFLVMSVVLVVAVYLLHRRYELYHQYSVQAVPSSADNHVQPRAAVVPQTAQEVSHPRKVVVSQATPVSTPPVAESVVVQGPSVSIPKRTSAPDIQGHVVQLRKRT